MHPTRTQRTPRGATLTLAHANRLARRISRRAAVTRNAVHPDALWDVQVDRAFEAHEPMTAAALRALIKEML